MKPRSCRDCDWAREEEESGRYYLRCMEPGHMPGRAPVPCDEWTDGKEAVDNPELEEME